MFVRVLPLLFAAAQASLHISVTLPTSESDMKVQVLGEDVAVISDQEAGTFRLTDAPLKESCRQYSGVRPTQVFLHSPTDWGDLYQTYGWQQVHRVLKPVKVNLLGIKSEPEVIAAQRYTNNGRQTAQYKAELSQWVRTTMTHSWTTGNTINVGQEVNYKFELPIVEVGGKTTVSYSRQWGEGGSHSKDSTTKASAGVIVPVAPGAAVIASLTASRGEIELEVIYEASLYGMIAVNYENELDGHHFWGYDVNDVLRSGGLPKTVSRTEVIKVGFYTDVEISLDDKTDRRR